MQPKRLDQTFLNKLEYQLAGWLKTNPEFSIGYYYWLKAIRNPAVKRVLFDAEQAAEFAPLEEFPDKLKGAVQPPFDAFYMEFSEPVTINTELWGVHPNDQLYAILYVDIQQRPLNICRQPATAASLAVVQKIHASHMVLFYYSKKDNIFTDRTIMVNLDLHEAYVTRKMAETGVEMSRSLDGQLPLKRMEEQVEAHDRSTGLENVPGEGYDEQNYQGTAFQAGAWPEGRHVGWWERQAQTTLSFFSWCCAYMMAKSVIIERRETPLTRQDRRRIERKKLPLPPPWHVVMVDPKYVEAFHDDEAVGRQHRYRYDVIGHIRVNRHRVGKKREDGTYEMKETLEWVPAHQRGPETGPYVPKTYNVAQGRKIPKLTEINTVEQESIVE